MTLTEALLLRISQLEAEVARLYEALNCYLTDSREDADEAEARAEALREAKARAIEAGDVIQLRMCDGRMRVGGGMS